MANRSPNRSPTRGNRLLQRRNSSSPLKYCGKSGGKSSVHEGLSEVTTSAPPAYESVVPPTDRFAYVDVWPRCYNKSEEVKQAPFDSFDEVVKRANSWISSHPNVTMRSCETVEKKVSHIHHVYNERMHFRNGDSPAAYVKGLRLWCSVERYNTRTPTELAFVNVMPLRLNPGDKNPRYESLEEMTSRLNSCLKSQPLPGRLFSVEIVPVRIAKYIWRACDGNINPDQCSWVDDYDKHILYFLRAFYIKGQPQRHHIGFKDFVPDRTSSSKNSANCAGNPLLFCPFHNVCSQARDWIKHQKQGINIINMKTLQTPLVKTKLDEHDTESGNMFVYKISRYTHIQFLRVTYLRDDSEGGADGGGPSLRAPFLTHKTFVPKCIGETAGDKNFESMSDLMQRIKIWLEATDAVVLCSEWAGPVAERVALTIGVEVTECKGEWYFTRTTGKNKKEVIDQVPRPTKLLYYVRLYLDGEYKDPDIKTKQIQTKEKDEECHIL